jgi:hypothetical protein
MMQLGQNSKCNAANPVVDVADRNGCAPFTAAGQSLLNLFNDESRDSASAA